MRFPVSYTVILFLTFLFLLLTFYFFYETDLSKFIGNINNKLYIYSSLICIFGFSILYLYILIKDDFTKKDIDRIFVRILTILKCAILWIISAYYNIKILNILFLGILCIVNLDLIIVIKNLKEKKYNLLKNLSLVSLSYLLFHHIIIDLFLWNYYN
jgi:hypothetical protein